MNDRTRQIIKLQLEQFRKNRMVMAAVRDGGVTRAVFMRQDEVEEYKRRYGDKIQIIGERGE